ncbi:MAG: metallophosphoesterase [Cytophagales bacterium]|nr:metallophosphoesterase [Cytophagales bacterium]
MKSSFKLSLAPFLLLFFFKCKVPPAEAPIFQHELADGATPWSHVEFDEDSANFTFAIITDLTGGEREGVFNTAVVQLNLLRPELVMSVGDLIEGDTENRDQLTKEWDSFDNRASKLIAPLFRVGGNHDLMNVEMRKVWSDRYGPKYYYFLYKDVLFLVLDSEDFKEEKLQEIYVARKEAMAIIRGEKEGVFEETEYAKMKESQTGEISVKQSDYFRYVIASNPDVRWTFVFLHKPVWKREDEGGMAKIEAALGDRSYTLFNGHIHSFSYTEKNERDYTILGTTGGFQKPGDENAFDHISLITMTNEGPNVAHVKMDGILDKSGSIPNGTIE